MKKSLILTIILMFMLPTAVFADFEDMAGKDGEMRQAVELLAQKRYITGKSETVFEPDSSISRAEFAAIVLRMLNCMNTIRPYYMEDVPKKSWYYYTAGSALEYGIMSGFEDNTFRGDEPIQKVQAITIAARTLKSKAGIMAGETPLGFADEVPQWAEEYVKIAVNGELIENGGEFLPYGAISRGDAAIILARMYEQVKDKLNPEGYTGSYEPVKPPITVVIDPGHGKDSGYMSDEEKFAEGWLWNDAKGQWGEWRHWQPYTAWQDCGGCDGRGECWYRMENGDRETEPPINLSNASNAAKYLMEKGYEVRMTRSSDDENPSMTKRLIYCYPNNDVNAVPDADLFVCVHSNAGGGRGSAYVELAGEYNQKWIPWDYADRGNTLGRYINDEIVASTSVSRHGEGKISGLPELILFCKSPVPIAYMEIGFFDNSNDLNILRNESDNIGKAIAEGIDKYCIDYIK